MACNVNGIYEKLKSQIINLDYVPGMKIREEDLVIKFKVSRTPIRAVISRLASDGFLEVVPKRGTYVTKIDTKNISDSLYIRKAVEMSMLKTLIYIITDDQINQLEKILEEQKHIIEKEPSLEKSKAFFHNDNLFHATMFKFSNLDGVWAQIHTKQNNLNRVRIFANLRETNKVEEVYSEHMHMLDALKKRDVNEALTEFNKHLDEGFEGIDSVINKYKEYFI